ncbi:hypothetical protein M422DRAFT_774298 [Sphaerobolus stellatus SS14]|nr:hypothetical protein M422DRAFT_774298 [Sphaerobolus stellatus SS14]
MSLPQQHHPSQQDESSQSQSQSQSPSLVRYDSIQGALGGRRVAPLPVAYLRQTQQSGPPLGPPMPSERYVYPQTSASTSTSNLSQNPYYSHYSPASSTSYETHYSHNSLPRMRTPHSNSVQEPPRAPSTSHSQQGYMPYLAYSQPPQPPPPQYAVPSGLPTSTSSWDLNYPRYPESETPTEASQSPELIRNESAPQPPPTSYRSTEPPYSSHSQSVRQPSSSTRDVGSLEPKGKQREQPPSPVVQQEQQGQQSSPRPRPQLAQQPDYLKLLDTYRTICESVHEITPAGPPSAPSGLITTSSMLRIYESALDGVRNFDHSNSPAPPSRSPSPRSRPPSRDDNSTGKNPAKRQRTDSVAPESQRCLGCGATSTPEWRRGPLGTFNGPRTLCNACGLVYAKLIKKRGREAAGRSIMEGAAAAGGTAVPGDFVQEYAPMASGSNVHPPHQMQHHQPHIPPPQHPHQLHPPLHHHQQHHEDDPREGSEESSLLEYPRRHGSSRGGALE